MTKTETLKLKPISHHMYGFLKAVRNGSVNLHTLRTTRDITAWACVKRGYIVRIVSGGAAFLGLSDDGDRAYRFYHYAKLPERQKDGELSQRLSDQLEAAKLQGRQQRAS